MVERVARAICRAHAHLALRASMDRMSIDAWVDKHWRVEIEAAVAAISAIEVEKP